MIFLPPKKNRANSAIKSVEEAIKEGQSLMDGDVPVDDSVLGETVNAPIIKQFFIEKGKTQN